MEWFNGGVLNAISKCRQEKALFIVYICDDSDASLSTSEAWNCDEVIQILKNTKAVALKVFKDSTEFNQFSQFFAVFIFPSIYCIDLSGKPLVVMNGKQTEGVLKKKLEEAVLKLQKQLNADKINTSESESVSSNMSPESMDSPIESREEKLKRYEEKIKERRADRAESDRQHDGKEEKDRRSQGRELMQFRDMQTERKNKRFLKERQKEKEDAELARAEVRAKLEQDKREREDRQRNVTYQRRQEAASTLTDRHKQGSSNSGMSRIQLRLPMGSTQVVELNIDDTLGILRQRVSEVLNSSTFSLTRLYPRQELTTDMNMQSMVELKLVPTGVVIVRDNRKAMSNGDTNLIWTTLMSAVKFIMWIFSIIKNVVVNLFTSSETSDPNPTVRQENYGGRTRRFHQDDEDSDDMGTYNGNSTQQQ